MSNDDHAAKNRAIALLAQREHSKHDLIRKLVQKGFHSEASIRVVTQLEAENLQSNARFSEMLVRSRAGQGYGWQRVLSELKEHQIDSDIIKQAEVENDTDWYELCRQVWQKKFKNTPPKDWKEKQKQMRFLVNRGFTRDQIEEVLGNS